MSRAWPLLLVALCALCPQTSRAASRILFYQPLRADLAVPETAWPGLFARVRDMGFDTLAVQWVAYGDAFVSGPGRAWLARRLREARAAHLKLVLGLGADPDFFQQQKAPPTSLRVYLQGLAQADLALARSWRDRLGPGAITAWYLPTEIDDQRWRDPDARKVLIDHLRRETRALQAVLPVPVTITSFFTGRMAPASYARLLEHLRQAGVHVWVQDGAGTGKLTRAERALYLEPLLTCRKPLVQGVVYEIFLQVAGDEAFAARPMPAARQRKVLARRAPCGRDSVVFGMRYLPGMQRLRAAGRPPVAPAPPADGGP